MEIDTACRYIFKLNILRDHPFNFKGEEGYGDFLESKFCFRFAAQRKRNFGIRCRNKFFSIHVKDRKKNVIKLTEKKCFPQKTIAPTPSS